MVTFQAASSLAWVYNNVWWGNDNGGQQYLIYRTNDVLFENNIVAQTVGGGIFAYVPISSLDYNNSFGNSGDDWPTNQPGNLPDTNLTADPRFVDPDAGDFHLLSGFSPCEDAGNPLSGYNDVDGSRNDMGAYGGAAGSW